MVEDCLVGKILVAMPYIQDEFFKKSLIYICAHNGDGAMGLMINRLVHNMSFSDLIDQLTFEEEKNFENDCFNSGVYFGGPVESSRGFVLHSRDYQSDLTLAVDAHVGVTANVDILRTIASGNGPDKSLLALGYSGWTSGQLEEELYQHDWMYIDADDDLLFCDNYATKWQLAIKKIGFDVMRLSHRVGTA